MHHLVHGKTLKEISKLLGVAFQTAAKHRTRVLEKLHAENDVELVRRVLASRPRTNLARHNGAAEWLVA